MVLFDLITIIIKPLLQPFNDDRRLYFNQPQKYNEWIQKYPHIDLWANLMKLFGGTDKDAKLS